MPAELDSMFWVAEDGAPWHQQGTRVEYKVDSGKEAQTLAGLDWTADLKPLYFESNLTIKKVTEEGHWYRENQKVESDRFAVVRSDTEAYLGSVGRKFEHMQNDQLFALLDEIAGSGDIEYRTAGALKGGRIVWALMSLPSFMRVGKDDIVNQFLLASNAHDGSRSLRLNPTDVRVVCNNTLTQADAIADSQEKGGVISIQKFWHTAGINQRAWDHAKAMAGIRELSKKTEELYNELAKHHVDQVEVDGFMDDIFPIAEDAKRPTRMLNMREKVLNRFEGSELGADLETSRGTAWGLYNALAAYTDHDQGNDVDQRTFNAWFGRGVTMKEQGLAYVSGLL